MTNMTHKFLSAYLFLFITLHISSTSCSSSGETNCVNTTSGNCHSVLVVVSCAGWEWTGLVGLVCWLPVLVAMSRAGAHDTATNTEWQLPEVVLTQFVSPDDKHDVLETCRELQIKINTQKGICASRWSFTKNNIWDLE